MGSNPIGIAQKIRVGCNRLSGKQLVVGSSPIILPTRDVAQLAEQLYILRLQLYIRITNLGVVHAS